MSGFSSECPSSRPARLLRSGGLSKSLKIKEFTKVNDCFQNKSNDVPSEARSRIPFEIKQFMSKSDIMYKL